MSHTQPLPGITRRDDGLLFDDERNMVFGFLIDFHDRGVYHPDGKTPIPPELVKAHNEALEKLEIDHLKQAGRGILYLTQDEKKRTVVTSWTGGFKRNAYYSRTSWHNFAGRNGRTDVWFCWDGNVWHGVNIGDSQILRVKRTKTRSAA